MIRFVAALLTVWTFSTPLCAQDAWFALKGEDGTPVANHRVPVELESQIESLPGIVVVGNPVTVTGPSVAWMAVIWLPPPRAQSFRVRLPVAPWTVTTRSLPFKA